MLAAVHSAPEHNGRFWFAISVAELTWVLALPVLVASACKAVPGLAWAWLRHAAAVVSLTSLLLASKVVMVALLVAPISGLDLAAVGAVASLQSFYCGLLYGLARAAGAAYRALARSRFAANRSAGLCEAMQVVGTASRGGTIDIDRMVAELGQLATLAKDDRATARRRLLALFESVRGPGGRTAAAGRQHEN